MPRLECVRVGERAIPVRVSLCVWAVFYCHSWGSCMEMETGLDLPGGTACVTWVPRPPLYPCKYFKKHLCMNRICVVLKCKFTQHHFWVVTDSSWFSIQGVRKINPRVVTVIKKLTTELIMHKSINGDTRLVRIWVFLKISIYKGRRYKGRQGRRYSS